MGHQDPMNLEFRKGNLTQLRSQSTYEHVGTNILLISSALAELQNDTQIFIYFAIKTALRGFLMEKLFISNLNIETFVGWRDSAAAIKRKVLPECKQYPVLPLSPLSLSRTLVPKCPADFSVKEFKQQFESSVRIAVERKIKQGSVHKDGRRLFMEDLTFLTA